METTTTTKLEAGTRVAFKQTGAVGTVTNREFAPRVLWNTDWPTVGFWSPVQFDDGLLCWCRTATLEVL